MMSVGKELNMSRKKLVLAGDGGRKRGSRREGGREGGVGGVDEGLTRGSLEVVLGTGQGLCDEDSLSIVVGCVQLQDHVSEEEEVGAVVDDPEDGLVVEEGCLQGEGHRPKEGKEGGEELP